MYFDENNNYYAVSKEEENINIDKYIDKYEYEPTNINVGNIIFNRHSDKIVNPVEGFNKGNMFENLYSKYKNYVYNLKVSNKKDELLYKIQIYNFALRDLGLYLDLHPTDTNTIKLFLDYNKELSKLKAEYNNNYSPLSMNEMNSTTKWTWLNNPWPWDKGGNI